MSLSWGLLLGASVKPLLPLINIQYQRYSTAFIYLFISDCYRELGRCPLIPSMDVKRYLSFFIKIYTWGFLWGALIYPLSIRDWYRGFQWSLCIPLGWLNLLSGALMIPLGKMLPISLYWGISIVASAMPLHTPYTLPIYLFPQNRLWLGGFAFSW